jgi:tricarballylate dehydrogenase
VTRVVVAGGGNAGLCAAITARERGADVVLLERASQHLRGGNSRHTRNIRTAHEAPDDYVTAPYPPEELRADIEQVTQSGCDPVLTDDLVSRSLALPAWMWDHGVRWQAPLRGTLNLSRTNRFFLGGGKALVNAYYRRAGECGIDVRYESEVVGLVMDGATCDAVVVRANGSDTELRCDALVAAAGGFEANLDWLAESWGDAASNFIVRGTPLNTGGVLRLLLDVGARAIGDPSRFHAVAVDARSPRFDGGIVTRLDAIPIGIAVNRRGDRFYDEGEDIWPKRYAIWGRLIAQQEDQRAYAIVDDRRRNDIMPPVFPPYRADTIRGLAARIEIDPDRLEATVSGYNAAVPRGCRSSLEVLDGCATVGLEPPKSNWALPIDSPPFLAFPMRPGITFTYHGLAVDTEGHVKTADGAFANVYAAGEIMAGNILTQGYLAGIGMTIGSVSGRIAGESAAAHA